MNRITHSVVLHKTEMCWSHSVIVDENSQALLINALQDHRAPSPFFTCALTCALHANLSSRMNVHLFLPQKWSYGAPKIAPFEIESRITLELNAAKNTVYIRKCVKKFFRIKFPSKNSVGCISITPRSGARDDPYIKYITQNTKDIS